MKKGSKKTAPVREVQIIRVHPQKMSLSDWRNVAELVTEAKKMEDNTVFISMLDVLRNEQPVNYGVSGTVDATTALRYLGKIEGYQLALNNLEMMSKPIKKLVALTATFQNNDLEKKA